MKLNNRFIFGILSLLLAAVIAFVALPTIARQTNGKEESLPARSVLYRFRPMLHSTASLLVKLQSR